MRRKNVGTFDKRISGFVIALSVTWRLGAQIEPDAGIWKTWVLSSSAEFRLAPPPGPAETATEIEFLKVYIGEHQRSPEMMKQVRYWTAGSPSYRWVEIALNQIQNKGLSNPRNARAMALMNIAIYDAMVDAWSIKYSYNRPRPAQVDSTLPVAVATPKSPSYPSEL